MSLTFKTFTITAENSWETQSNEGVVTTFGTALCCSC